MKYWLIKSEPTTYSIEDLIRDKQTIWDGVRNYQARNFLQDMEVGDRAFFYHSNTEPPGIVGLTRIIATQIADPTQFDDRSPYYDAKSTIEKPRWMTVKIEFAIAFPRIISLPELKSQFTDSELLAVKRGNRLSVIPVAEKIAEQILEMSK